MNLKIDSHKFGREFAGWLVRGALCAIPSAFWAVLGDFTHPLEIAAIVLGLVMVVALFSLFCSRRSLANEGDKMGLVRALKIAVWIKVAIQLGAVVGLMLSSVFRLRGMESPLMAALAPDMFGGAMSLRIVGCLGGIRGDVDAIGRLDSFGFTAATTIMQGLLLTLLLVLIAWGVMGYWKIAVVFKSKHSVTAMPGGR